MNLLKLLLALLFSFNFTFCFSQQLKVEEALSYLEKTITNSFEKDRLVPGDKSVQLILEGNTLIIRYYWKGNDDIILPAFLSRGIFYNSISFDILKVGDPFKGRYKDSYTVNLNCKDGTKYCFENQTTAIISYYTEEFSDDPSSINHFKHIHLFFLPDEYTRNIIFNGLEYIFYKIKEKDGEKKRDLPPAMAIGKEAAKNSVIQLKDLGGVSTLSVNMGGIKTKAILDSGASDVSIPEGLFNELLNQGVIEEKNMLSPGLYSIADGSVVVSKRFIIPLMIVGNVGVPNVECSVNQSQDMLLLGKSFLNRFKSWKINNEFNQLILEI